MAFRNWTILLNILICLNFLPLAHSYIAIDEVSCTADQRSHIATAILELWKLTENAHTSFKKPQDAWVLKMFRGESASNMGQEAEWVQSHYQMIIEMFRPGDTITLFCSDTHLEQVKGPFGVTDPWDRVRAQPIELPNGKVWDDWQNCKDSKKLAYTLVSTNDIILCPDMLAESENNLIEYQDTPSKLRRFMVDDLDQTLPRAQYEADVMSKINSANYDRIDIIFGRSLAGVIMHELFHTKGGGKFSDYDAPNGPGGLSYCWNGCRDLTKMGLEGLTKAISNPDSYRWYAIATFIPGIDWSEQIAMQVEAVKKLHEKLAELESPEVRRRYLAGWKYS
ncbi:uncharacterized protein BDZ99DRAFT_475544 [Mytilinidion resinicola]|uniref:Zincin n=1 Tax=Mytilinidion resinicola TaxID=574789 RepID=A0A6A6YP07_9PEZI|nr:uncharacterized protein BDZ99DRAFT_475544 [Mytilinidion resinicola]KAF2810626.1 hypothetical protein BDZ99DRAFT_475544 [Mytilinidion resinicola]